MMPPTLKEARARLTGTQPGPSSFSSSSSSTHSLSPASLSSFSSSSVGPPSLALVFGASNQGPAMGIKRAASYNSSLHYEKKQERKRQKNRRRVAAPFNRSFSADLIREQGRKYGWQEDMHGEEQRKRQHQRQQRKQRHSQLKHQQAINSIAGSIPKNGGKKMSISHDVITGRRTLTDLQRQRLVEAKQKLGGITKIESRGVAPTIHATSGEDVETTLRRHHLRSKHQHRRYSDPPPQDSHTTSTSPTSLFTHMTVLRKEEFEGKSNGKVLSRLLLRKRKKEKREDELKTSDLKVDGCDLQRKEEGEGTAKEKRTDSAKKNRNPTNLDITKKRDEEERTSPGTAYRGATSRTRKRISINGLSPEELARLGKAKERWSTQSGNHKEEAKRLKPKSGTQIHIPDNRGSPRLTAVESVNEHYQQSTKAGNRSTTVMSNKKHVQAREEAYIPRRRVYGGSGVYGSISTHKRKKLEKHRDEQSCSNIPTSSGRALSNVEIINLIEARNKWLGELGKKVPSSFTSPYPPTSSYAIKNDELRKLFEERTQARKQRESTKEERNGYVSGSDMLEEPDPPSLSSEPDDTDDESTAEENEDDEIEEKKHEEIEKTQAGRRVRGRGRDIEQEPAKPRHPTQSTLKWEIVDQVVLPHNVRTHMRTSQQPGELCLARDPEISFLEMLLAIPHQLLSPTVSTIVITALLGIIVLLVLVIVQERRRINGE
ncbi:hypothetical protein QOT17_019604 [Balamuthia mandrillaris]